MQTVRALGACLAGTGAELVTVEGRFDRREKDRTEVLITGLPDPVIRESRERLLCALEACGMHLERGRLFLNLVPAARRKSGETLDLPLVLSAAAATGHLDPRTLRGTLFLGEVGIDGTLHAVPGGLSAALLAREQGLTSLLAPPATAREAAWIPGIQALGAEHLDDVVAHLCPGGRRIAPHQPRLDDASPLEQPTLDDVRGQASAKYALTVAAAGGHGILFVGPPGAGKSLLARRLVSLLPPPSLEESLEITRVLSAAGRWPGGLARARPYRAPHHTISYAGLVGGGSPPSAGEITLAHCGVLFLDELPEFRREVLEALRQPLESGMVLLSRAGRQLELPARFQLVCAMNPCHCGYRGHPRVPCRCPPGFVERYRRRISGPLLDRIDLRLEILPTTLDELAPPALASDGGERHSALLARALAARERQRSRQGERGNCELTGDDLDRWVPLGGEGRALLARAARRLALSARAIQSLRRVARTIADLEGAAAVEPQHLARALALRSPEV